jgi:LCP family protein required for cell wall assembly
MPPRGRLPGAPGAPPPGDGPGDRPTWRRWSLGRILLACALVLLFAAISSAVFVLEEVHTLSNDLAQNGALEVRPGQLAPTAAGAPQTLLLVGDDQRSLTKYYHVAVPHLANEMLLVRIDPSKPYISMMSIPRELWVPIHTPGGGTFINRINAAYTYGIGTLVSTIKQDIGLSVNHVVVITFGRFKRAVDQMGCVYSTVDRRYFHVNVPGGPQYQEINLQPGYQKLCGDEALQFVSYRHGDTSQVRDARDQAFLLDVKKQYGPTLVDNIHKFEQIFGQAVQTDPGLQSTGGILDLLDTLIASSGRRVRQVHFQANLLSTYDTASPQQIQASVHAFLYGGSSALPTQHTAAVAHQVHKNKQQVTAQLPLVPTTRAQLAQARGQATNLPFPLEYPRAQDRGGAGIPVDIRGYLIHAPDGSAYPAYVAVFATATLGQYYDVQGTAWTTAPQFDSPDQTVTVGGRTYYLYYEASNLRMVAWYEHGAVYWIRNTLTDSLDNGEMLAIAEQTEPFTVGAPGKHPAVLQETGVPTRTAPAQPISLRQTLGGIGGLVALVALPLLLVVAIRRRRELVEVRRHLAAAAPLGARVNAATAHIPDLPIAILPLRYRHHDGRHDGRRSGPARAGLLALLAVAVMGGAGAGIYFLVSSGQASTAQTSATSAQTRSKPVVPSLPVTVLNSGSAPGSAASLAVSLRAQGVKVVSVGNVQEQRPPGIQVLFVPGQQPQAELLAHLLSSQRPTVAPIDPVAQAAAGPSAQLVIVIS